MKEYINTTTFNMRIERDVLKFMKMQAIHLDCSMTDLANKLFSDYKIKIEKKRKEDAVKEQ